MKTPLFIIALFFSVALQAQIVFQIDSVRFSPASPSPSTPVFMHIYGYCNQLCTLSYQPVIQHNGLSHSVDACYMITMAMSITYIDDSLQLFTGPAGLHTVTWNIGGNYNSPPPCSSIASSGSATINVLSTGITGPLFKNETVLVFDPQSENIFVDRAEKDSELIVSDVSGRIVFREKMESASGTFQLPQLSDGLFIASVASQGRISASGKFIITH